MAHEIHGRAQIRIVAHETHEKTRKQEAEVARESARMSADLIHHKALRTRSVLCDLCGLL